MEPGIESYDARIQEALGGPRLETVQVNGVNLTYVEKGQGDSVILVHGGPGDYRGWSSQVEIFLPEISCHILQQTLFLL